MQSLKIGVGRRNITPAIGALLMGYADAHGQRVAKSVRDPLHVTSLVIESEDRLAALISLDLCMVEDRLVQSIRTGIADRTHIDETNVIMHATHTHCAPRTASRWGWGDVDEYYVNEIMLPETVAATVEAAQQLVPARVGYAETRCDVGIARRSLNENHDVVLGQQAWGVYDPTMTVLRIDGPDGPLANVIHYGAHPTVFNKASRVVSRDWPGIMIDRVEELTGATTLYFNGGIGDVAPRTNSRRAVGDGTEAALWEAGAVAALDAIRAWRSIKELRDVKMHTRTGTFEIPYQPLTPLDEARRKLAEWEPQKNGPGAGVAEYRHWQAVIEAHSRPPLSSKVYQQTIATLGPAVFVPFPGEPFAELSLRLREASPFQHTLGLSTSCGDNGYLFTREAAARGGYEVWVNRVFGANLLADHVGDTLVQENVDLLHQLHRVAYRPLHADVSAAIADV